MSNSKPTYAQKLDRLASEPEACESHSPCNSQAIKRRVGCIHLEGYNMFAGVVWRVMVEDGRLIRGGFDRRCPAKVRFFQAGV